MNRLKSSSLSQNASGSNEFLHLSPSPVKSRTGSTTPRCSGEHELKRIVLLGHEEPLKKHNRTETTVVKDITQSYQFISALSNQGELEGLPFYIGLSLDSNELEGRTNQESCLDTNSPKAQKHRQISVLSRKSQLNEVNSSHSSEAQSEWLEEFRKNNGRPLPSKLYCPACKLYVSVSIKYQPVRISFWTRVCCNDCLTQSYMALHCCRLCQLVLTKVNFDV